MGAAGTPDTTPPGDGSATRPPMHDDPGDIRTMEDVLRQMPVGVVVTDAAGSLVLGNDVADALIGPPVTDEPARRAYVVRRPDGTEYDWTDLPAAEALHTGSHVHDHELAVLCPDGTERTVAISAAPVHGQDGKVRFAVSVLADVSEARALERQRSTLHLRLERLQEVTAALAAARTPEQVLDVVLSQVVDGVGAQAASAALLDDDGRTLEVAAAVGHGPGALQRYQAFDIDDPGPLATASRSGEPIVQGNGDGAGGHVSGSWADGPDAGTWVALPLTTENRTLGALRFNFPAQHRIEDVEIGFLTAVATQCAQALFRSRLHKDEAAARTEAEVARERLAFLAEASNVLASTLDPQQTLTYVAELAVPRLGDWCVVSLRDAEGKLVPRAAAHIDTPKARLAREVVELCPASPNAPAGSGAVLRTGRSELHRHIPDEVLAEVATSAEELESLRGVGLHSSMIVPLRARGRILGTMTIATGAGRQADETDLALAEEAATRAAVAIDNAQMFAERSHASRALQASLLPPRLALVPGIDVGAAYLAAGTGVEVGGDFYDAVELGDGRWLYVVGDVCGKGIDAASVTGIARHTIRAVATGAEAPSGTLRPLNRALRRAAKERGEEEVDARFATVCAVAVDPSGPGATVTVCSAGHPLPLLLHGDRTVEAIGEPGMALGIFDDPELELFDRSFELCPGDALVCLTDGILERRDGQRFFEDELHRTVAAAADSDAAGIAARIRADAEAFSSEPPADDMAVLVLRVPLG